MSTHGHEPGDPDFEKEWRSLVARLDPDDSPIGPDPADIDAGHPADGSVLDPAPDSPLEPPANDFGFATNRQWSPEELDEDDEGEYVPPEPPPLGWLESPPIVVLCWIGATCAPLYALFVVLFWHNAPGYTILIAIAAFIAGVAGLIISMPDHRDDTDDGAVV